MNDLKRLTEERQQQQQKQWQLWLAANQNLNEAIFSRRKNQFVDIDMIWNASHTDLEERHGE